MTETPARRPTTLTDYLAILRRRKLIIVVVPIVTALGALQYSSSRPSVYEAQAKVLVTPTVGVDPNPAASDPARYLRTVAKIARAPALAGRVAAKAGVPGLTADAVLASSSVTPDPDADVLSISVSYGNPSAAVLIANTYADRLPSYKDEVERAQTSGKALSNLRVIEPAADAIKTQPRPRRDFILGGLLGAVFAVGLVFLAEALDRRIRNDTEVEELLQLPLLGRISRPPHSLRMENRLVMVTEPTGVHAEMFRKLRGAIEFVDFQRRAASSSIMFTSAVKREGKSTTIANLAIALAQSERRVALIDLDLRTPFLHTFFGVREEPGFADVVVGRETLDRAVRRLSVPAAGKPHAPGESNDQGANSPSVPTRAPDADAILHLLPCGTIPPAAGAFLATDRVSALLEELHRKFDVVLVDAPPLTVVGDAMTLSATVDAIVVVASVRTDRPTLEELARELQKCVAPTLGVVLTDVPLTDRHRDGYGYGRYHHGGRLRAQLRARASQLLLGARPRRVATGDQPLDAPPHERLTSAEPDTSKREDARPSARRPTKANRAPLQSAPTADQGLDEPPAGSKREDVRPRARRPTKGNAAPLPSAPTADQAVGATPDEPPTGTDADTDKREDARPSARRRTKGNAAPLPSGPTADQALDALREELLTGADTDTGKREDARPSARRRIKGNGAPPPSAPTTDQPLDATTHEPLTSADADASKREDARPSARRRPRRKAG